jgi:hypothetical protein
MRERRGSIYRAACDGAGAQLEILMSNSRLNRRGSGSNAGGRTTHDPLLYRSQSLEAER